MADETFIDTSGFFALLVSRDRWHGAARQHLRRASDAGSRLLTTDYVLDEVVTLLRARGHGHLVGPLFATIDRSAAMRIEWTGQDRFNEARDFCLRHADKPWSFTDCLSFVVMHAHGVRDALTSDSHFEQAGFRPLLSAR